jgi:hypothetical protein
VTVPLCYYGSPEPLPERRELRAGPLVATYEAGDLRYVTVGGVEVCRRWYAAVRDRNWGTVPGVISDEVIEESAGGFRVTYTRTHRQGDIHFVWRAEIVGTPGSVTFTFDGEAQSTFLRNRIGFCVLHPPDTCAGQPVRLNGTEETKFPTAIAPWNPFRELRELSHTVPYGGRVTWTFDGDLFETEDQRNWTDASFKTFCTPLRLPFPVEVKAGDRVRQVVTLKVEDVRPPQDGRLPPGELHVGWEVMGRPPHLGLCASARPLTAGELDLLRLLRPGHLRVELDLTRPDFAGRLRQATAEATVLDAFLELALFASDDVRAEGERLAAALDEIRPPVSRAMLFHTREWVTPRRIVGPLRAALDDYDLEVAAFAGTAANFTELNRGRAELPSLDGVCYSVQPQEHTFDNASLVECCGTISQTAWDARQFARRVAVGPVTLRKRVNPYATGPWEPPPPDPRQGSLFGAAWTLGTLDPLRHAAAASFYETVGPRGVIDGGRVFPLFHVLADALEMAESDVMRFDTSDWLRLAALVLADGTRTRVMVANTTAEPLAVTLDGLSPEVHVRTLDETTFDLATTDPVAFRSAPGGTTATHDRKLTLTLRPYAYVRIDG